MSLTKQLLACTALLAGVSASAAPIVTVGAGTAVQTVLRSTSFDGIGGDLTNYVSNGLRVAVPGSNCCFSGVHYEAGGNTAYVTITTPESLNFSALEVEVGSGYSDTMLNVVWQTLLDGNVTGSGMVPMFGSNGLANGFSVFGIRDLGLFDTLRIGAAPSAYAYTSFGQFQAIALDNLRIGSAAAVPEPATLGLLGLALACMGFVRRKRG